MIGLYDRYRSGSYQDVYNELLSVHERIFDEMIYEDAIAVTKEMMRRVRYNIELLVPRLRILGYRFGEGFWDNFEDISPEEKATIEKDIPVFRPPSSAIQEQINVLEQLVGTLPLSLKYWYEIVGSINLIGLFQEDDRREMNRSYGSIVDPLFVYSIDMAITMVTEQRRMGTWDSNPKLSIAPDNYHKYGYSGSGAYSINLPSRAIDAPLLLERHNTTFINYLRICFQWGGFPGLEIENRLSDEELHFLTESFLQF